VRIGHENRIVEDSQLSHPRIYGIGFPCFVCGNLWANDSGKTNVVRAIRALVKEESVLPFVMVREEPDLSVKEDYPKWKATDASKREIEFAIGVSLNRERDAGFYQVVVKQLELPNPPETLKLLITAVYRADRTEPLVTVNTCGKEYSDLNAQEVLKKLQSSRSILFYNSTQVDPRAFFGGQSTAGYIREITGQYAHQVLSMKRSVDRTLAKISRTQQAELEALLGRLETKYKVGLTLPTFDLGQFPFSIT
jgi:putative ATP-dependent endonuclease of the OLD family